MDYMSNDIAIKSEIEAYLLQALEIYDLAGLACGVRIGEDSPLASAGLDEAFACGFADYEEKLPLGVGDAFHCASISKLFTGEAALRLAGEGALGLDGKLTEYLPDFHMADERYRDITIRHILSHTSGIPDIEDYHWREPETDSDALSRYAHSDEVRSLRLLWEPGSGNFRYSNIAFDVLGAALENITGKPFEQLMPKYFFEPLGMRDSTFFTPLRDLGGPRLVKPHYKDEEKHIRVQPYFPYNRAHAPSSTLTSTLHNIKKFGDAYIAQSPQREAVLPHANVSGSKEKIGLAWFIREQNGYTLYGHEGADDGFRSSFWICPTLRLQITVLANLDRSPVKRISKKIFDILT
jgi:CubicO group peptidase (beta-lactamase class C family)